MNLLESTKENYINFHIGIDDTDSLEGMCTTYLGAKLFFELSKLYPLVEIHDFPYLLRLNPNVPHRTKGNGCVILYGQVHSSLVSIFQSMILKTFNKYSQIESTNTNPGLIIWYGEIPDQLYKFGQRALYDIIPISDVEEFIQLRNVIYYSPKSKLGLIGSLAGIGLLHQLLDVTYELLIYRNPPYFPSRNENKKTIWEINEDKYKLFNCVDYTNKSIKIIPRGLDPVFCGIRGEDPFLLLEYWKAIQPQPEYEFWIIFKTNQGTNAHIITTPINSFDHPLFLPYRVIKIEGFVYSNPIMELGGHVSFEFKDLISKKTIRVYAYEPTKGFRFKIKNLIIGDKIEISGNIRPSSEFFPESINLEQILILKLVEKEVKLNPKCQLCNKRMESAGKNQPFRCKKCKTFTTKSNFETYIEQRNLIENKIYLPDIDAQRHLTKPLKRISRNEGINLNNSIDKKEIWIPKLINQNS